MDHDADNPRKSSRMATGGAVLGSALLGAVLWVLIVWPPQGADLGAPSLVSQKLAASDLDAGTQLGTESISHLGPLGAYLATDFLDSAGTHTLRFIVRGLALALAVLGLILASLTVRTWPYRLAFLLLPLLLLMLAPEATEPLAILAWTVALVWGVKSGRVLIACGLIFMAAASSAALANFLLAIPCVLAIALRGGEYFSWRRFLIVPVVFAALWTGIWMATGQSLDALPDFMCGWIEVLRASGDHLSIREPGPLPFFVFVSGAFLCAALFFSAFLRPWSFRRLIAVAIIALGAFAAVRPGLILQDSGHALVYYVVAALLAALVPVSEDAGRMTRILIHLTRGPALGLAVIAAIMQADASGTGLTDVPDLAEARVRRALDVVSSTSAARARGRSSSEIARLTAGKAVDPFGGGAANLLLGEISVQHRPVSQAGLALTPKLAKLNADFLSADDAPPFVLARLGPSGGILPTMLDPGSFQILCHRYRPVLEEGEHILLERRSDAGALPEPHGVGWSTVNSGDTIKLDGFDGKAQLLSINLELTEFGLARRILYRDPPADLVLMEEGGKEHRFRITVRGARTPFLVNPLITTTKEWSSYYRGEKPRRIVAVKVEVRPAHRRFFKADFKVRVSSNDALDPGRQQNRNPPQTLPEEVLALLPAEPHDARPVINFKRVEEGGKVLLQAHATSELRFRLAPGSWTLSGSFGLRPATWIEGATDGVEFVIMEVEEGGTPREIFRRLLQPKEREEDRGPQSLEVPFIFKTARSLILITGPGAARNSDDDWAYWSDLKLARAPD